MTVLNSFHFPLQTKDKETMFKRHVSLLMGIVVVLVVLLIFTSVATIFYFTSTKNLQG